MILEDLLFDSGELDKLSRNYPSSLLRQNKILRLLRRLVVCLTISSCLVANTI